jgi:hypothetical protein
MPSKDSLTQGLIARALEQPAFRKELVDDPSKAIGDVVGKRVRASASAANRTTLEKVLALVVEDVSFRERITADASKALRDAGLKVQHEHSASAQDLKKECYAWSLIEYSEW